MTDRFRPALVGLALIGLSVGPTTRALLAQQPAGFRSAASVPAHRLISAMGYDAIRMPPSPLRREGKTQTGVIIGVTAGLTAGWLLGRSMGDNFSTRLMITFAALGAILGLAFSPRPD